MGTIRFRQAKPWDASAIVGIKRAAIDSIEADEYTDEQLTAWRPDDDAVSDFERAIRSDIFDVLLAEVTDELAAYGVLNVRDSRIDAVFVRPTYTGQGIASSLVRQFETRAQMHGLTELDIVASMNARPFYQSLDYWDFGTKTRNINDVELEFAVMRKVLDHS